MEKENKEKSWITKHPLRSVFGILLIIVVIGLISNSSDGESKSVNTAQAVNSNNYINEEIYDLWATFVSRYSSLTDLQKEEGFKEYENKFIMSSEIISNIDEVGFGSSNIIVAIESPENPYLRAGTLYFDNSYKNQLMSYEIGDEINFEGKIEQYNSLLGIIIKETKLK